MKHPVIRLSGGVAAAVVAALTLGTLAAVALRAEDAPRLGTADWAAIRALGGMGEAGAKHAEETYGCTSFDFRIINQAMRRLVQKVNGRRFSYKRIALYRAFLRRDLRRDQGFVKIAGQDFAKTN